MANVTSCWCVVRKPAVEIRVYATGVTRQEVSTSSAVSDLACRVGVVFILPVCLFVSPVPGPLPWRFGGLFPSSLAPFFSFIFLLRDSPVSHVSLPSLLPACVSISALLSAKVQRYDNKRLDCLC